VLHIPQSLSIALFADKALSNLVELEAFGLQTDEEESPKQD
jgi:hypothetical protein